jgi:hypothetical protein
MVDYPYPDLWADPRVWVIAAVVIIIMTIILIRYKVFEGEKGP